MLTSSKLSTKYRSPSSRVRLLPSALFLHVPLRLPFHQNPPANHPCPSQVSRRSLLELERLTLILESTTTPRTHRQNIAQSLADLHLQESSDHLPLLPEESTPSTYHLLRNRPSSTTPLHSLENFLWPLSPLLPQYVPTIPFSVSSLTKARYISLRPHETSEESSQTRMENTWYPSRLALRRPSPSLSSFESPLLDLPALGETHSHRTSVLPSFAMKAPIDSETRRLSQFQDLIKLDLSNAVKAVYLPKNSPTLSISEPSILPI